MDVDRRPDVIENLVVRSESGIVSSAIDVGGFDFEGLFAKPLGDEF